MRITTRGKIVAATVMALMAVGTILSAYWAFTLLTTPPAYVQAATDAKTIYLKADPENAAVVADSNPLGRDPIQGTCKEYTSYTYIQNFCKEWNTTPPGDLSGVLDYAEAVMPAWMFQQLLQTDELQGRQTEVHDETVYSWAWDSSTESLTLTVRPAN